MIFKIDVLLGAYNTSREQLIEKNPDYEKDFEKLDKYYQLYENNPSNVMEDKLNQTVLNYVEKLKKENPDVFEEKASAPVDEEKESKIKQLEKDFYSLVELGNVGDVNEFLGELDNDIVKKLITSQNYKAVHIATTGRDELVTNYLIEQSERLGILSDVVVARNGVILSNIVSMQDMAAIKKAIEGLKQDPETAKSVLKKALIVEQAAETGNEEIAEMFDDLYSELGVEKKGKAKEVVKEQKSIKSFIEGIKSGQIGTDVVLVAGMDKRMTIYNMNTPEEIAANTTYQYVVPTQYAKIFNDKIVGQDEEYTRFEAKSNDFERRFGATVYDFGFAWFNMLNLMSVNDVIAMMYIANISSEVMVERKDQTLREEYRSNLSALINFPENSKIGGKFYQVTQTNVENLQRAGFLDAEFCPTKLMYCAVVLHSFSFPAFTHPFELVTIGSLDNIFQFNVLRGEYSNQTFFTDGDLLYHNFADVLAVQNDLLMMDVARTIALNIKSRGRTDIEQASAEFTRFFPLFYSVPKSQVSIPTFSIEMLDVNNRNINWGVYEVTDANKNKVYVNSYGLDNFINMYKADDVNVSTYKGSLSSQLFTNPKEGVILSYDKKTVVARAINETSFLSENFGENYEKYYEAMFEKNYLKTQILDELESEFQNALAATPSMRILKISPELSYTTVKKVATPYVAKQTVKPAPVKDDRIYLSKKDSRDLIDKKYWPVFDVVMNIKGEQRDEAILDQMTYLKLDTIRPKQLLFLGFDLDKWKVSGTTLKFKSKYRLRIPNLGYTYYVEKI